mmetsp:Transcript_6644/g.9872  ORF Transcript_6644/g.9872 Transcript_6644/m.9872 type:complete len:104 (+) Transcript_6644:307-618(+)
MMLAMLFMITNSLLLMVDPQISTFEVFDSSALTFIFRLFFVSWFPSNSTPYAKMAYTQAKEKVREVFTGVFDIMARTPSELEALVTGEPEEEEDQEFDDDDFN